MDRNKHEMLRQQRVDLRLSRAELAARACVDEATLEFFEYGLVDPGQVWREHVERTLNMIGREVNA